MMREPAFGSTMNSDYPIGSRRNLVIAVVPSDLMSDSGARLDISPIDGGVAVGGELDAHTSPQLAAALAELPPGDHDIIIDVGQIEFMDSSGLRVVIDVHQRAADAGRRLVLRQPSASVQRLLEVSGLSDHLTTD